MEVQGVRQTWPGFHQGTPSDRVQAEARGSLEFYQRRSRRQREAARPIQCTQCCQAQEGNGRGRKGQGGQAEKTFKVGTGETEGREEEWVSLFQTVRPVTDLSRGCGHPAEVRGATDVKREPSPAYFIPQTQSYYLLLCIVSALKVARRPLQKNTTYPIDRFAAWLRQRGCSYD